MASIMTTNDFFSALVEATLKRGLFRRNDSILVGVSGGADSVFLLYFLIELSKQQPLTIGVAHVNHCLRGEESVRDSDFVRELSARLDLPCHIGSFDVKRFQKEHRLSTEEAARRVRYDFFYQTAKKNKYDKIATGHHADDNAELILMNLIRGSGASGLSGMQAVRGVLVRPLLDVSKYELTDCLDLLGVPYIYDSSNSDTTFLRNRVRLELLPLIEAKYNGNIKKTLNRTGRLIADEENWLNGIVEPAFRGMIESMDEKSISLVADKFNSCHIAEKRRIARMAVNEAKGDLRRISQQHIEMILALAETTGSKSVDLPGRIRIYKSGAFIRIVRESQNLRTLSEIKNRLFVEFAYSVERPFDREIVVELKEVEKKIKISEFFCGDDFDFRNKGRVCAMLDVNKLSFPLVVRNVRPGDCFKPLGMKGSQTLKKFFSNRKIPKDERIKCPVVISEDRIAWVATGQIDDSFKLGPETEKVLKIELLLD